jgi:hypothetical protein
MLKIPLSAGFSTVCCFLLGRRFMTSFRRVDARYASPSALGILVPPGPRTLVILRPRALEWDLLPLRPGWERVQPAVFCTFEREEAAGVARRVQQALQHGAAKSPHPLEVVATTAGAGFGICARVDHFLWIVCARVTGQPYQPYLFGDMQAAELGTAQLVPFLWPRADAGQEYYFNTQAFAP